MYLETRKREWAYTWVLPLIKSGASSWKQDLPEDHLLQARQKPFCSTDPVLGERIWMFYEMKCFDEEVDHRSFPSCWVFAHWSRLWRVPCSQRWGSSSRRALAPSMQVRPLSPKHNAHELHLVKCCWEGVLCFLDIPFSLPKSVVHHGAAKNRGLGRGCGIGWDKEMDSNREKNTVFFSVPTWSAKKGNASLWKHLLFNWNYPSTTGELADFKRPKDKVRTF